jgi:chaperonin cofactor prefoldin
MTALLSAQIRQQETLLAQLTEENNSLELAALSQEFHFHSTDRPIALHNALVDLEEDLFASDPSSLSDQLPALRESIPSLESEIANLDSIVNDKRDHLKSLLSEIYDAEPPPTPAGPPPRAPCSADVERLAREWSDELSDVDEDALVNYLARGPALYSPADLLEHSKRLAEVLCEVRTAELVNRQLERLIPRIDEIADSSRDRLEAPEELTAEIEAAAAELAAMAEPEGDAPPADDSWAELEAFAREVARLRVALLEIAATQPPLPAAVLERDGGTPALADCLGALRASTHALRAHLAALQDQGIVEARVADFEDVRELVERHAALGLGRKK